MIDEMDPNKFFAVSDNEPKINRSQIKPSEYQKSAANIARNNLPTSPYDELDPQKLSDTQALREWVKSYRSFLTPKPRKINSTSSTLNYSDSSSLHPLPPKTSF